YTSDITRTIWFGDLPSEEFRKVFNVVHDAQTAAMALGRPGTPCEEMDRAARKVITAAGYGPFFTHRLGHGLGMDGHEPEYLVEGNKTRPEPGIGFTIQPGLYQLGEFGHHPRHVPFHLVVAERYRGGELSGVIRPRGRVRLQRGHRLRHGAGREREADPPSRHRIGLAHSVDHDHALEQVVRQVEERG